ncbi:MAG: hypothetical protein KKD50_03165 [Proteobacteria bacterium]|nr:hypothetical protein [Pseudomonadota bacterium]
MKRSLIFILSIIFSIVLCSQVKAEVAGDCVDCHTMHNSQGGAEMADYGPSSGVNPCLTRGDCIGCHAYDTTGASIQTIGVSVVPQVWHNGTDLAAGNFRYIASDANDRKGHNVAAIDSEGTAAMFATNGAPGAESALSITAANFSCAGKYGCHGDRTITDETASIKDAHHTDDSTIDGNSTGTSYRFLKGVLGLENTNTAWRNVSSTDHNEYKGVDGPGTTSSTTTPANGTISGLCGECHGYYHGTAATETGGTSSPWLRHPTDFSLPSSGEYTNYTTYSIVTPVARTNVSAVSSTVNPGGTTDDIVMCLSCHGAHATNYYKLMRWDYANSSLLTALTGCAVCHASKN